MNGQHERERARDNEMKLQEGERNLHRALRDICLRHLLIHGGGAFLLGRKLSAGLLFSRRGDQMLQPTKTRITVYVGHS